MKKKLTALLSVILAFVMSFALIACNGNNSTPDGTEPEKPGDTQNPGTTTPENPGTTTPENPGTTTPENPNAGMTKKAANAVASLLEEKGVKATVEIKLSSKSGNDDMDITVPVQKSGNILKATVPVIEPETPEIIPAAEGDGQETVTYIINLDTGYAYTATEVNGALTADGYKAGIPAGLFDYVKYMWKTVTAGEDADLTEFDDRITYDKEKSTVALSYDIKDKINEYTDPLTSGYKYQRNLTTLLDDYLDLFTGGEIVFAPIVGKPGASLVEVVTGFIASLQNQTFGEILGVLKTTGEFDLEKILAENEIDVAELLKAYFDIDTTWEKIKARKLGEMILGAYDVVSGLIGSNKAPEKGVNTLDGETPDIEPAPEPGMEQYLPMIGAVIDGALNYEPKEGDKSASAVAKELFDMLIVLTDGVKVNKLVDENLAPIAPELAEFIKSNVQVTKAKADMSIKLGTNDKLDELTINAEFAHNYTKAQMPEDFVLLADNDYSVSVKLKVEETSSTPAAIEFAYGDILSSQSVSLPSAVVYGTATEDLKIYVDLAGAQNKPEFNIAVDIAAESPRVTFDAATSCIVVNASYLNAYFAKPENGDTLSLDVLVSYDTGSISSTVTVTRLPEKPDGLKDYLLNLVKGFIGGMGQM